MRYLFFTLLLVIGNISFGQNTSISESQFIQIEMGKIEKFLNTPDLTLSNQQSSDLRALFIQKYAKVNKSWNSKLSKSEVSERRNEIEKEYTPLVEGILTSDQRLTLMKTRPTHHK